MVDKAGKCYGLVIEHHEDKIINYYVSEFEDQIAFFDGFLHSAMDLGKSYKDGGYKHLDFGLIRFNLTNRKSLLFLVITNEAVPKKIGFRTLRDVVHLFEKKYQTNKLQDNLDDNSTLLEIEFKQYIETTNEKLAKLFFVKQELHSLLEDDLQAEENLSKIEDELIELLSKEKFFGLAKSKQMELLKAKIERRVKVE